MADILSLSKARKSKARAEKAATAAENRVRFGRTKAEKARDAKAQTRAQQTIDGHRREPD